MKTGLFIHYGKWLCVLILVPVISGFFCDPAAAEDMRRLSQKALHDNRQAVKINRETLAVIASDRKRLAEKTGLLKERIRQLKKSVDAKEKDLVNLQTEERELAGKKSYNAAGLRELSGAVRVAAKNLDGILRQSHFTASAPDRLSALVPVLDSKRFPGLDDMTAVSDLFFDEIKKTAAVRLFEGEFTDRNGAEVSGDLLTVGPFTAAYRTDKETGFLSYSEKNQKLYALSRLPSWLMVKRLADYMDGDADNVLVDISRGAALRQITGKPGLLERVGQGGLLVWPILIIGLVALGIGLERVLFLKSVHDNTDLVMGQVNILADAGKWEECDKIVAEKKDRPVNNVLRSGLAAKKEDRETLESILQESILKELPRLEKYLPMLNMMGSVSPLIGLLGTVTGMISTFHVITLYGTGDPRMMSGGISTALVTTMLGLAVAIPIMLLHTFLNGKVEHIIGDMEEKAVALTNIINRSKPEL